MLQLDTKEHKYIKKFLTKIKMVEIEKAPNIEETEINSINGVLTLIGRAQEKDLETLVYLHNALSNAREKFKKGEKVKFSTGAVPEVEETTFAAPEDVSKKTPLEKALGEIEKCTEERKLEKLAERTDKKIENLTGISAKELKEFGENLDIEVDRPEKTGEGFRRAKEITEAIASIRKKARKEAKKKRVLIPAFEVSEKLRLQYEDSLFPMIESIFKEGKDPRGSRKLMKAASSLEGRSSTSAEDIVDDAVHTWKEKRDIELYGEEKEEEEEKKGVAPVPKEALEGLEEELEEEKRA